MHALVDGNGVARKLLLTPGNVHDAPCAQKLLDGLDLTGKYLLGDRGYDSQSIVNIVHDSGGIVVIPSRCNSKSPREIDMVLYKMRNVIERFFAKIKRFRRIATRYEKYPDSFLAFILFAAILTTINCF